MSDDSPRDGADPSQEPRPGEPGRNRSGPRVAVAVRAATAAGLDVTGANVLRSRSATLVRLPAAGVVARVEPPGGELRAAQQWAVATFFAERGAPTMRLLPGSEVFEDADGAVTLWSWVPNRPGPLRARAHGRLLRALHSASEGALPSGLPAMDAAGDAWFFLERARDHVAPSSWQMLSDAISTTSEGVGWRGPAAVVHGDPHGDNVLLTDDGPVFVDLELSGVGPRAWDAAVLDVQVRRFGEPSSWWPSFVSGYGSDPRGTPGYEDLVRLYEIAVVAWAICAGADDVALAEEGRRRLATIEGRAEHRWRQF